MRRWARDRGARELAFACTTMFLACDRPASTSPPSTPSTASASAAAVATATPTSPATPVSTPRVPSPPPRDPKLPPTPEAWKAQGRPVAVEGADGFGCSGATLETWLRVACTGEGEQRATGVEVTRGGGDGMTFAVTQPRAASLVLPFIEGVDVRATFTFSGGEAELRVNWPREGAAPLTMSARK